MAHSGEDREQVEATLRQRHDAGDLVGAATLAIEAYGPEILGFLAATLGPAVEVDEVFSGFAEALWRALPRFRGDSSFRTWAYAIARRTALRAYRRARSHLRRLPCDSSAIAAAVERVRSTTAPYLRTSVKDDLGRLRAGLDDDEQALLILRVDRRLSWREIAQIFASDTAEALADDELRRQAAALRKRFERLKTRLSEQILAGRSDPT